MRFRSLKLIAYGPFRGLDLDLSAKGLHVVFGRNEAGKSTTLRAITGLLYGIDPRTTDTHVHKPTELRVGATLEGEDGSVVTVVRRKGLSNTLLDEQGEAVDETPLQRLLRGVSEETFRQAFGLDHLGLAAGAKALLEGRGDVGGSLFDASVGGGGDVRTLLVALEDEAEALYKPRASTLPLNVSLKAFTDLQKAVKEKERLPAAYVLQQATVEAGQKKHAELVQRRLEAVRRRAQVDSARRRVPLERKRAAGVAALSALGEVPKYVARITSLQARLAAYEVANAAYFEDTATASLRRASLAEAVRRAGAGAAGRRDEGSAAVSADLRMDTRTQARIRKLVQERSTLVTQLETANLELARNERALERLRAERDSSAEVDPVAAAALARAVAQARSLGDAASQLATQVARAARRHADLASRAAKMGFFEGPLADLVALRPPAAATLEELAARDGELERRAVRLAERVAELRTERDAFEQKLADASGDFAPPTAADLAAARRVRDEAMVPLQDAWIRAAEGAVPAGDRKLLSASFERALREVDAIADRMLAAADRVTTLARCHAQLATNAQQRTLLEDDGRALEEARAALSEEHEALWRRSGIVGSDPSGRRRVGSLLEMRDWLARHAQVVEAYAGVRESEADAEATARTIAAARDDLAAAVRTTLAVDEAVWRDKTLADLLDIGTARLTKIEEARRARTSAATAMLATTAQMDERQLGVLRDEAALHEVKRKLAELLMPLGVDAAADADEVLGAVEGLRELFVLEDQCIELEARAKVAREQVTLFEEEALALATTLAPDLTALPAREVVAELAARSKRAEAAQQQVRDADAQLDEGGTEPIPSDLLALVSDNEAATHAIEQLDARLAELADELTQVTHSNARVEVGLDQMRADTGAAEASAAAQEALARVRVDLERYVRAKTAALLLSREIERYREENQGPLLTKASQLFARLTLGGFTGVRAGYDEKDRPALRCVRDGNVEVDVAGLSEGTRDQLYLSLRLASLLRYADMAEPMPLILDDVLIQFDDERSRAALSVIAEVAARMQVLFFTHHARMVELAQAAVPSPSLTVHELASAARLPAFSLSLT